MKSEVYFGNEELKESYVKLKDSKFEDKQIYKWISKAIDNLEKNAFCGVNIPKKQIPEIYIKKFNVDNLWKYDLPKGWRLIYSVGKNEIIIISIILEWMPHKEYEKRFKY